MLSKTLVLAAIAAILLFCFGGCKKSGPEASSDEPAVKTMAEYEAEAKSQINEDNMEAELEKLEKEIEQDTGEGQ